ncbi:hypothetical protein BKA64DRAFT_642566 [Cadophora sp. MPI-SDFR-AT-0126]|nr:hypothetical protein BKA64DRAFT_642566 [Leotiomycetes sp. MPI-SDFR-AT-0126]
MYKNPEIIIADDEWGIRAGVSACPTVTSTGSKALRNSAGSRCVSGYLNLRLFLQAESLNVKYLYTTQILPQFNITYKDDIMATQITIEGSASERARILKVLQRYGLINHFNEITLSQAEFFDTFNKSQEMFNTTLEGQCQESNVLVKKLGEEAITHAEKRRDAEIESDMLSKSLEAKSRVNSTLHAIIAERNRLLDDSERTAVKLQNELDEVYGQLAVKTEQLNAKVADITDVVLSNLDDEWRRMVERIKELEENVDELETHQLTLSNKILKLKEENKSLQMDNEHKAKRLGLKDARLDKLTEENRMLKRAREEEQVDEEDEIDGEGEALLKRRKLELKQATRVRAHSI